MKSCLYCIIIGIFLLYTKLSVVAFQTCHSCASKFMKTQFRRLPSESTRGSNRFNILSTNSYEQIPIDSRKDLKWYTPKYDPEDIDVWWKQVSRPMLTIGAKGVSESHINSLNELVRDHERVRIRLAHDSIDPVEVTMALINSSILRNPIEAIHIRTREIMIGRIRNS